MSGCSATSYTRSFSGSYLLQGSAMPLGMGLGPINELSFCDDEAAACAVCDGGGQYTRSFSDCTKSKGSNSSPNEALSSQGHTRSLSLGSVRATAAADSAKACRSCPEKGKNAQYESWKQYPVWYLASRAVLSILEQAYKGTTFLQARTKRGAPLVEEQIEVLAASIRPAMELLLEQGAFVQKELLKDSVAADGGCDKSGLGRCTNILQNCLEAMEKLKVAMVAQLNVAGSAKTQYGRIRTLRMALSDFLRIFRVIKGAELLVLQSQKRPAIANRKLQQFRKSLDAEKSALLIGWLPSQQDARTWSRKAGCSIFTAVRSAPRQWLIFQKQVCVPLQQLSSPWGLSLGGSMSFTQCNSMERPRNSTEYPSTARHLLTAWKKCKETTVSLVPKLRRSSENDASPRSASGFNRSRSASVSSPARTRIALRRFTVT